MTLPKNGKKLTKIEEESMEIALKEAGIRAIHPERMEALAESMVEKLKTPPNTSVRNTKWSSQHQKHSKKKKINNRIIFR